MSDFTSAVKDRAVLLGWVAGLALVAALFWSFSFSFRSVCLMNSTNKTLAAMDDARRLSIPLPRTHAAVPEPLGCWYRISGTDSLFFVFTIMRGGILVPCGAEISENGKLVEIIPLGGHARQVMGQIPQGLIQIYGRRIESAAAVIARAAEKGER
ncbi:MAG: hypothetical protein LBG95_04105 [Treponema sp.]|jgi:hypothetical protein|nr:hypothetical protein [Treponema sp.]